jgi:hypothetical protein
MAPNSHEALKTISDVLALGSSLPIYPKFKGGDLLIIQTHAKQLLVKHA